MRRGLRDVKLPRIHRVTKNGKVYRWHRPTRVKLPDDLPETHPDFIAAWANAEALGGKAPSKTPAGTIAAELEATLATAQFKSFSNTYRHEVRREADAIRASYAKAPIAGLREHHISADLAKLPPRQANARLKTWRLICKSAKARGVIRSDPFSGLSKTQIDTAGYASWSDADISVFRARWPIGTVQRACFELVFWSGARTVDAVQIGRQHLGPMACSCSGKAKLAASRMLPGHMSCQHLRPPGKQSGIRLTGPWSASHKE
mgnify:CR=1 FL=1